MTPSNSSSSSGSTGGSATFVYVADAVPTGPLDLNVQFTGAGAIIEFQMAANGTLTPVAGSPLAFSSNMPMSLAPDPLGRFIFGASASDIYTFSIDASTGALTQVAMIAAPSSSAPMVVDHAGSFLYALMANGLGVFSIASKGA
jgi:6-phosphogluconolactonase (cycloisomerase 2 family)